METKASPGDLAEEILGQVATPETVAAMRRDPGLDLPSHIRHVEWLGSMLQGDFGHSLANQREIAELLAPIINVVVLNLAYLVVGVVVVEVMFVYPGMDQLLAERNPAAAASRD